MVLKSYPLSGKWIYIFSVYGCSLKSTNGQSFDIPAGFFALSRDEIQTYFTNNYLIVAVDDRDVSFTCFSYDFAINSVQPLSDVTNSLILQQISDSLLPLVSSIQNLTRINQNNLSILLNSYLVNNPSTDFGGMVGNYNSAGFFELYLPVNVTKFSGTYIASATIGSNPSSNIPTDSPINSYPYVPSSKPSFFPVGDFSLWWSQYVVYGSGSSSIPFRLFNSDGVEYQGVEWGQLNIKSLSCNGTMIWGNGGSEAVSNVDLSEAVSLSFSDGSLVFTFDHSVSADYSIVLPVGPSLSFSVEIAFSYDSASA